MPQPSTANARATVSATVCASSAQDLSRTTELHVKHHGQLKLGWANYCMKCSPRRQEPLRPLEPLDSEVVFGAGQLGSSCGELPSGSVMSKSCQPRTAVVTGWPLCDLLLAMLRASCYRRSPLRLPIHEFLPPQTTEAQRWQQSRLPLQQGSRLPSRRRSVRSSLPALPV